MAQKLETEEDFLTCLHINFYHPQQNNRRLFTTLPVGLRKKHEADEPVRLGRDEQTCSYSLPDQRVSRKQLALYAYRNPRCQEMLFTIQNLSQRGHLKVNGLALGHLERADLPDKALVRFGEYEAEIIRESGEAKGSFEVEFQVLAISPSREMCLCEPTTAPVMDTGLAPQGPQETDESFGLDV